MRRILPTAVAILGAVAFQVALAPHLVIGSAVPNFLLLIVIAVALIEGPRYGTTAGFAAGLAFDLIGTGPIGPMALVLCVVGFIAGSLQENMFAEGWRLPVTVVVITSFITELGYWMVLGIAGVGESFWSTFITVMLPGALYNGVLALVMFPWLARFLRSDRPMTTFNRLG